MNALWRLTGAPKSVLNDWINGVYDLKLDKRVGGWEEERRRFHDTAIESIKQANAESIEKVLNYGTGILSYYLEGVLRDKPDLDMNDLKNISTIISQIDRIDRLEKNKPTGVTETRRLSQDELRKRLGEISEIDPYGYYAGEEKPVDSKKKAIN